MGLLDKIFGKQKSVEKTSEELSEISSRDEASESVQNRQKGEMSGGESDERTNNAQVMKADEICDDIEEIKDIILASTSRIVEDEEYGDEDSRYLISFKVNDSFREAKSHAAEIEMLHTYAPGKEYGSEATFPYLAVQVDDDVYCAVEEFKEKGTFDGAMELTPLNNKFYFKAKKEYYQYMMYFYGLDRCDGFWENNGLCMVYPKEYVGTENEIKLMSVLDEAAESYREEQKTEED